MRTRDDILAAAQRCLNAEPTASTTRLAEAAGVGRATLHRHFATRELLLRELGVRSLERWQQRLDEVEVDTLARSGDAAAVATGLRQLLSAFVADGDEFGFALTDTYLTTLPELTARAGALFDREVTLYRRAQMVGVLRADVPARWLGHAAYGLLVAAREALHAGDVARRDLPGLVHTGFVAGGGAR